MKSVVPLVVLFIVVSLSSTSSWNINGWNPWKTPVPEKAVPDSETSAKEMKETPKQLMGGNISLGVFSFLGYLKVLFYAHSICSSAKTCTVSSTIYSTIVSTSTTNIISTVVPTTTTTTSPPIGK
jgi:hypothetical protein